jgi:hypothetical protein
VVSVLISCRLAPRSAVGRRGGKSPSCDERAKPDLVRRAREPGISGRSAMTKARLVTAAH